MPTYQYSCTECGHFLEAVQSFSDDSLTVCPQCEGRLRKVFNAVGVVFKGSGFYRNDSRSAPKEGGSQDGSAKDGGSKDGGSKDGGSKDGATKDSGSKDGGSKETSGGKEKPAASKPSSDAKTSAASSA